MKKVILCILLSIAASSIQAQIILKGENAPINSSIEEKLKKQIRDYKLYTLDISLLAKTVKGKPGKTDVRLILGKDTLLLTLFPNDVRSSNYTSSENGNKVNNLPLEELITYAGYVNNDVANYIRFTISEKKFKGYIFFNNEFLYFDQLKQFDFAKDKSTNTVIT